MLFTIIIPVHNAEKYIKRCIDSLLDQDVMTQIILVENGSSDQSFSICQEYASANHNVEVLISDRKGVSAARNLGLQYARGDVIGFCDADDYYEKNCLRDVIKAFEKTHADLVITSFKRVADNVEEVYSNKKEELVGVSKAIDYIMNNPNILGSVCNKFYKRELLPNIHFPEEITHLEDGYMNLQLLTLSRSISIFVSKIHTYYYVTNRNSASRDISQCFDCYGNLKFNISLYRMLNDFELSHQEQSSIKEQIYRLSIMYYYGNKLPDTMKASLYKEIKANWMNYTAQIYKGDINRRIKYIIKGLLIIFRII